MQVNGIPKTEIIWVSYKARDGTEYYTTSKSDRSMYFLYRFDNGKAIKLGKSKNPTELEEKYICKEKVQNE